MVKTLGAVRSLGGDGLRNLTVSWMTMHVMLPDVALLHRPSILVRVVV